VGYLPESAPLYLEMRVEEYLKFIAELRGLKGCKGQEAINEALEATALTARRKQEISTLSKGYKQRVGIAQAIIHKPSILILDEPTNGLDPVQIQEIRALIKRLAKDTTILLSTHILSEIEAVCDRVVILIDGELACDSGLEDLFSKASVSLKLKDAQDVEQKLLSHFDHLETASYLTQDADGFEQYLIQVKESVNPSTLISDLAELCLKEKWVLGGLSVETQSLESAFRNLMSEHVARALES
jgi:ABC-2 type transport system ATP-binding protein